LSSNLGNYSLGRCPVGGRWGWTRRAGRWINSMRPWLRIGERTLNWDMGPGRDDPRPNILGRRCIAVPVGLVGG
jgi:hypothetical protein